jgi:hypothetical protein
MYEVVLGVEVSKRFPFWEGVIPVLRKAMASTKIPAQAKA